MKKYENSVSSSVRIRLGNSVKKSKKNRIWVRYEIRLKNATELYRTSPNSSLFNRTITNSKNLDRIWIRWPPNYSVFGSVRKSSPWPIRNFYCNKNSNSFHKLKKNLGTFFRWSYFDFDFIKILFGGHMSTFWDF